MMKRSNLSSCFVVSAIVLSLVACSSPAMKTADTTKPGFSNITDIAIPQTANMDLNKSMVVGGADSWTGHLVYDTKKPKVQVIDYINGNMQDRGWTKISELRGNESVMTFIKDSRLASVRVSENKGFISSKTNVAIDMSLSNMKHNVVNELIDMKTSTEESENS